jgi:hypothetical protein
MARSAERPVPRRSGARVDDREDAWTLVMDRLPDGWRVGPRSYDPRGRHCEVVAMSPEAARPAVEAAYVIGTGIDAPVRTSRPRMVAQAITATTRRQHPSRGASISIVGLLGPSRRARR